MNHSISMESSLELYRACTGDIGFAVLRCLVLLGFLLNPAAGRAQVDRGAAISTITNLTPALIPGVQIIAVNPETVQVYKSVTNDTGIDNLLNLPIAGCDITCSKPEFATFVMVADRDEWL